MAYSPIAFDPIAYDVVPSAVHIYTSSNSYWIPLKCLVEVYDNTGNTLLLSYDMFNPEANEVKLLECTVSLGLTNTQFTLKFEDGFGVINQNTIGLGNKILVYAGRSSDHLTLLFTGYSENRTPTIMADHVMDYEMSGYGENAALNDIIVNFKRASSSLTEIEDPNFPKRPDSKMVVYELVKDLFEDRDVRATNDIILKDYLNLDISGISPLVTERLLSIVRSMTEVTQVLNFLTEVTGAYWNIENGKLYFEYPEVKHSGIIIKNKVANTDLAGSTSYFLGQWTYTDSISKDKGFANRIFTTTATDTKSIANSMTNKGATALFDRAIAVQVTLLETRLTTIALLLSKIGDPFTSLADAEALRGGTATNPPPTVITCPTGYHKDSTGQCVPDVVVPPVCPTGYVFNTTTQTCVPDGTVTPPCPTDYTFNTTTQRCEPDDPEDPQPTDTCPTGYTFNTTTQTCIPDVIAPPVCPIDYVWNQTQQRCVLDTTIPPPPGTEGEYDSYGIQWLVGRGEQSVVEMSRDEATDDRWSGNNTGLRNGIEATFIGRSSGVGSDGHFAMKIFGGNHSGSGAEDQRWYDFGIRSNGDIQTEWEGPHPSNHSFSLPSSKQFITNIGVELDGNWIGLKWCVQTVTPNGSPANGGVRCRMWVDTDPINTTTNRPNNNWRLAFDFIDGVDVEVIDPQDYEAPDEQDCEVRRSDTDTHDIYGLGEIIEGAGEGDPGLHVRTLGTPANPPSTTCPSGYHWETTLGRCVLDTTTPICPTGYHWESGLGRCILDTVTPPPAGGTAFKFNIGGDFRAGTDAENTADNLVSDNPDVIFMLGDYAVGDATEEEWCNEIMAPVKNLGKPIWGLNGNHDNDNYLSVDFFENTSWVWSVKYGNIMFISCDTIAENVSATQTLVAAAQANSTINRIVILMHESVFKQENGGTDGSDTTIEYHNMFKQYSKLKLVIAGHSHNWTRFAPWEGIQYIICEDGGQEPDADTGCMHCSSDASGNITCRMITNLGVTLDTFTLTANGTVSASRVNASNTAPKSKKCVPFDDPHTKRRAKLLKSSKKYRENVKQVHEQTFSIDNKIVQSASQLPEQIVHGEIRIDNENKPTGPIISQFKVEVGGLSSTADTIFVNDIKVDASVLAPNGKYWLVLLPCGTSNRNTVLWHHNGDMVTLDKYSAFAKGQTRNDLSDWQISRYGPTYCHAIFARLRRIQEYSDPQSIQKFRLKEDIAEADFLDDSLSVAKLMQNVLAIRGKPVREYTLNEVSLPTEKWFTPGQNVTIVDSTGHHPESSNIMASIQEVSYSWSTSASDKTIGTFKVNVLPVGSLNWHRSLLEDNQ